MIVIGLGSGRSGTASLAKLLNAQDDALCFHEMNPASVRFSGTPRPFLNAIDEFQAIIDGGDPRMLTVDLSRAVSARAYDELCSMKQVRLIGDIAFYYLNYVELLAKHNRNVRFICLRRDRQQTIRSWLAKSTIQRWPSKRVADRLSAILMRAPYAEAASKAEAIGKYWDYYYEEAEALGRKLGDTFWIVDTGLLDERSFQCTLLEFCGIPAGEQVHVDAHIHRSAGD
jgi:hypothetical protein